MEIIFISNVILFFLTLYLEYRYFNTEDQLEKIEILVMISIAISFILNT